MHKVQPKTLIARIAKTAEEIVTEHFDADLNEIEFAVLEREAERIGAHLGALIEHTRKLAESFGMTIEERPIHKHVRGFTTSSHDRWFGPGASKTHGGSGCEILYGFAGDAHLPQINPFKQDVLTLTGGLGSAMHVIIDAMNFLHRSRAGGLGGERAVLFNSCRNLRAELERHNASACTLVWEGRPLARHALIPGEYKANRVQIPGSQEDTKLKAFFEQVDTVREFIARYLPLRGVYNPSHEADDVIAALGIESAAREPTVIVSSDTDFTQLAGLHERLYVWSPRIKDYLSHPGYDYAVWKALRGDSADNVEGFRGVGDVTATALASDPERLTLWLDAAPGRWEKFSVNLRLIRFFSPIEVLPGTVTAFGQTGSAYSPEGCREAFRKLGFESLRGDRYLSRWHDTFGKLRTW